MNGIGGNGFMTVFDKKTGHVYSLAMAGATPKALKAESMTPERSAPGINAGIVPGNFGGYLTALERFGTMSLADVRVGDRLRRSRLSDRSVACDCDRTRAGATSRSIRRPPRSFCQADGRRRPGSC